MKTGYYNEDLSATVFPGPVFLLAPSCENDFWTTVDQRDDICAWTSMGEALAYIDLDCTLIRARAVPVYKVL